MQPIFHELAKLYESIEGTYDTVGRLLDFTCEDCPDNCCDSYFTHHTYLEWAYLWEGFRQLPEEKRNLCLRKAAEYVKLSEEALAQERRPVVMCPLNEKGRCSLYAHRLLICRMHGVPASFTLPNGQKKSFPGCFRCQEVTAGRGELPSMDRTKFFRDMVRLEQEFLGHKRYLLPKMKMTIADMLLKGEPTLCRDDRKN
jgi:hypothetical protein